MGSKNIFVPCSGAHTQLKCGILYSGDCMCYCVKPNQHAITLEIESEKILETKYHICTILL